VTFPVRRAAYAGMWGMVVRAAGASKGTAIEWIARHEGVELSEVIAVGDWLNDIPMLEAAGRSFAMAHAPDEVKAAATEVLDADVLGGGGVEEAAQRAGLL
jgi:hydroxymethylpyrimidine pyrophosphatase-like HAD family hydrolase